MYTTKGRVVYDRARHDFTAKDALRVIRAVVRSGNAEDFGRGLAAIAKLWMNEESTGLVDGASLLVSFVTNYLTSIQIDLKESDLIQMIQKLWPLALGTQKVDTTSEEFLKYMPQFADKKE